MDRSIFQDAVRPLMSTEDTLPVINWMKENHLLANDLKCGNCDQIMNWTKYTSAKDGFTWKCQNKDCTKYKARASIRSKSFFANSNLPLQTWIFAIFLWSERTSQKNAISQLNVSEKTIVDIYNSFREMCSNYFEEYPVQLGGPGIVVEIDEPCFSHKPKQQCGRDPISPLWVLSFVDTNIEPAVGYMEIVDKCNADTLLPIIKKVVKPGTIIPSDEWKAYRRIQQDLEILHKTVDHSICFVDKNTQVHTQTIESYWNSQKSFIKSMHGCRSNLNSYLSEFMWHERHKDNTFLQFCATISSQYPFVFSLSSVPSLLLASNSRSMHASSSERSLLLGVISSHLSVLDARDNDSRSLRQKSLLWDKITQQFNALNPTPRSRHQIQTLYKNMKAKAKKYQIRLAEAQVDSLINTLPEPDPVSELLIQLLHTEHDQRRQQLKRTALCIADELSFANCDEQNASDFVSQQICEPVLANSINKNENYIEIKDENEMVENDNETTLSDDSTSSSANLGPQNNTPLGHFNLDGNSKYLLNDEPYVSVISTGYNSQSVASKEHGKPNTSFSSNSLGFMGYENYLKHTDAHIPTFAKSSKQCCCPNLHTELYHMAKTEHEMRMKNISEDDRRKEQIHVEKRKLIEMEKELCRKKLHLIENITGNIKQNENNINKGASIALAISELDKLPNGSSFQENSGASLSLE